MNKLHPTSTLERPHDRVLRSFSIGQIGADIASRLSCTGEGGCGAQDVAVFPHLYDLPWKWTPPTGGD